MKIAGSAEEKIEVLSADKQELLRLLLERQAGPAEQISVLPRGERLQPLRLPSSGAQRRLWFIDRLEAGSTAYHIPIALRLRGRLDPVTLQRALDALVERHEILRTVFVEDSGEPLQEIAPTGQLALPLTDLSEQPPQSREARLLEVLQEELARPFDLHRGPLIRGRLLRLSQHEHVLSLTMHHIVSDGWSIGILVREFVALYRAHEGGFAESLAPLPIQYADYANWQRQWSARPQLQAQLAYWKEHLQGAPALLELPADRPRPAVQSYRGATLAISLGSDLTTRLSELMRQLNLTPAMILFAGWCITLARLSGQDDIVVGTLVANRRRTELEGLIGFFVNTLAVRTRLDDDPSALDFLRRTREVLLGAYEHQDVPFEHIVEALQPTRSLSYSPIFQALFVLQNTPHDELRLPKLTLVEQEVPLPTAKFDLLLSLQEESDGDIHGSLNYATDLFDAGTVGRWLECFKAILDSMVRDTSLPVSRLQLISEDERRQVLGRFNATQAPYPQESLVHELFEQQVERAPDAIAVVFEGRSVSYAELNARSNRLARQLRERGVGADQLVGICVERSLEMVVGLLGILKAGGAYVPLDPYYPPERVQYMLQDAAPRVLLTQARLRERLPAASGDVIVLDDDCKEIAAHDSGNLDAGALGVTPRHLAYVIYTSGSTGKPKGAMNEHRGVVNRLHWMQEQYRLTEHDRVLQKTPFSFDVSVWEFFWPLMSGARLVVARPQGHQDPGYLRNLIEQTQITTLHFVPSMLQIFVEQLQAGQCPSLRHLICSGEELPASLQRKFFERLPDTRLSNLYGPTEAAVDVTFWECRADDPGARVAIGRPISNIQMYVLDRHHQPVPIGVAGEIYIGGIGVGRGYLNRPQLTRERFVPDPFSADPHARLYKTGDLGGWRADGAIEYLGRNDYQVKIRGFRIELGEIEAQLLRYESVTEASVLAREDVPGEKRLVAYLVGGPGEVRSIEDLRAHLSSALPEYMVPSAFVMLERMPLTPNGKLDRQALPVPELDAYRSRQYEAPQGEVEEILAGVWQSLLRVERVGRQDNFFELGGHSLLIVQMMERLRRVGLSAQLRRVFESPALADLAGALTNAALEQHEAPPNLIPPACERITPEMLPLVELRSEHIERIVRVVPGGAANIQDIYPLAPLQEGILFHHLMSEGGSDTYLAATLLAVPSRAQLDELIVALQAVIERHDVLRTAVLWEELPQPVQVVYRKASLRVDEIVLGCEQEPTQQVQERLARQQRLDLRQAPLLRLTVAADPRSDRIYVVLQLHHVVGDAVSQRLLISEVMSYLERRLDTLPQPGPYRNHVAQALAYARMHDAKAFFTDELGDLDEPSAPFGLTDVYGDGGEVDEACAELDLKLAQRLRLCARQLSVSAATLFHAAWGLVIAHTSGRDDVVFGSVLLGRLHGAAGAQHILGLFVNTLPIRLRLGGITVRDLVERTQRGLVELLSHEQASLALAQRCSGIGGSVPLFTALLNYKHGIQSADAAWTGSSGIQVLATRGGTNYPISLSVDDLGEGFSLTAKTQRPVDPSRVIGYVRTAVEALVEALSQRSQSLVLQLTVLSAEERRQVLESFNATQAAYPQDKLIHQAFEEQVARTPDLAAVTYEGQSLTYAALNARANQLARHLRAKGVGPDQLVALCLERSLEMIIGVLGILKAGGAYVPLDPDYPTERLQRIVKDAAPRVLLVRRSQGERLTNTGAKLVALDSDWQHIAQYDSTNLDASILGLCSHHLAYVIYTSGSTGQPKGVMVEHRNVSSLWQGLERIYRRSSGCRRVAVNASLNFDASVKQIVQVLSGRTLVLVPQHVRWDAHAMVSWIGRNRIDCIDCTPSQLKGWVAGGLLEGESYRPHMVLVGGEPIEAELWSALAQCSTIDFYNVYGPTESTVDATAALLKGDTTAPHIGEPMQNRQIYILDRHGQPAPIGVTGEMHIGGAGVARGYLNRPELTRERFLPNPFSADCEARLYKTGDLARWRSDGVIEYVGRNDHQVKIRGVRIELGEIEARLLQHDHVKQAVVITRESATGDQRLVAYVVTDRHADGAAGGRTARALRTHLRTALPEYMIPGAFVVLESLPLSANGKLDREALPAPDAGAYASGQYEAPLGEAEERVAQIWQELLGVERVGRHDSFFDLGGHSLLVLRMLFKVNEQCGSALRVLDVYGSPTLSELVARIRGDAGEDDVIDISEAALDDDIVVKHGLRRDSDGAVLLTGATGFVGRFLLAQLLHDTDATVYCLVRAPSRQQAASRLRSVLSKWDLWHEAFEPRVIAVPGDLHLPRLGVDEGDYALLSRSVSSIYHCGTSMNHLETYAMAKAANVGSAGEILRLATDQRLKLVNYVSTLSIFRRSTADAARLIAESTPIEHEAHRSSNGYVASKWVAENIFMSAGQRGIPCNIFRLGLVWADTRQGRYDELQRVYRIFKSCLLSGLGIENYRTEMPPTAVDYVARAIVYLANRYADGRGVFHISSAHQAIEGYFERCNEIAGTALQLLPYYEWICEMKRLHRAGRSMPVVPLIEFAFSMDEKSFHEWQQAVVSTSSRFDLRRTHTELEHAGIVAPVLNDELLKACVGSMLARDEELREVSGRDYEALLARRTSGLRLAGSDNVSRLARRREL